MATLLKKVFGSVTTSSSLNSSSSRLSVKKSEDVCFDQQMIRNRERERGSTGAFDRIPDEVFVVILKLLGPKEAAKLSVVCRTWRWIVADNRLWMYFLQHQQEEPCHSDSIFFAESHLRSGHPLHLLQDEGFCSDPVQIPHLSFMQIYGQRAQVPGSVIIDGGSGYCKFGWSKYHGPSGRSATFLEFGNLETPMYTRLRHFFFTIYSRMQVKPQNQPVVVSIPICHHDDTEAAKASRRQLKETMYSALFDLNVPAVCAISQATLALYAARRTSGIVVNIGFQHTSVVPILHGKVMSKVGVETVGMGALKLTGFLREQMQQRNISFESLYTVRELKEKLCYVALDYEAELRKDTRASYEVTREGVFTLSKERFQAGEILFQPGIAGVRAMGLHQAVALCIDHCDAAELTCDDSWFKTVVLCGGSACLPGLAERLEKELHDLLLPSVASGIRVVPPPYGVDSAWIGAKIVSNLSTFPGAWCLTKKQFRQKFKRNIMGSW